jgi:hypothetical protein
MRGKLLESYLMIDLSLNVNRGIKVMNGYEVESWKLAQ